MNNGEARHRDAAEHPAPRWEDPPWQDLGIPPEGRPARLPPLQYTLASSTLPADPAAEADVLGELLAGHRHPPDPRAPGLLDLDPASDFYHPAHQSIAEAIQTLAAQGAPTDPITVAGVIREAGTLPRLAALGGVALLHALAARGMNDAGIMRYRARTLRKLALQREIATRTELQRQRAEQGRDLGLLPGEVAELQRQLAELDRPGVSICSLADDIREDWGRPLPPAQSTGLDLLDHATGGGLRAESAMVLIGRTGNGKTGLGVQVASHTAESRPVLVLTSELSRRQMIARFLAPRVRRPWKELYELGPSEVERLISAAGPLAKNLHVVELTRGQRIREIIDRHAQALGSAPFTLLDYLQHAARRLAMEDPRGAVMALSQEASDAARELRTALLIISSVARAVAREDTGNKTAVDFVTAGAESGAIEYDASALLYLDCDPCPWGGTSEARLHVAKSRFSGGNATIGLRFHGALGLFEPEPAAALTLDLREALDLVRSAMNTAGRSSLSMEQARKAIGGKTERASALVHTLVKVGVLRRSPTGRGVELPAEDLK